MSIIKQSNIKRYIDNLRFTIEGNDKSNSYNFKDYEYLGETYKTLLKNDLLSNSFDVLFDFFAYRFDYSDENVVVKEIKKLFKKLNMSSFDLLLYTYKLNSIIFSWTNNDCKELDCLDDINLIVCNVVYYYKLFLLYCFDIVFNNKKISCNGLVGKYKDLDDAISLCYKDYKGFDIEVKELLGLSFCLSDEDKKNCSINTSAVPLFQKIKFKYDFIIIKELLQALLKEESSFYLSNYRLDIHVLSSLFSELIENEENIELSKNFYSLLKKRAYLLPEKGIHIKPSKVSIVIDMFERQLDGDNYLILISSPSNNKHNRYYYTFINLSKEFCINNSPFLYDLCNFIYSFYKLDDSAKIVFGKEFNESPSLFMSYNMNDISGVFGAIRMIKGRSSKIHLDYSVEVPYYWKYRGKCYPSHKKDEFLRDIKKGSSVYVSAFKRRLPKGQKASDNARSLAKIYCIELGDNETLVSPFTRCN